MRPTCLDWDSVQAHKDFIASPEYGPFTKNFMTILDGGVSLHHAHFDPHPPAAALSRAPITERMTFYFAGDMSESDMNSWDKNLKKLIKVLEDHAGEGYKGASAGWIVEELEHESIEGKAKAVTGVIGWESIEAHMEFRKHPAYQESVGSLGSGIKGSEMHHVKFQEI